MKITRGINGLSSTRRACVATIGNFDGVHRGHETVIRFLAEQGEKLGLPIVVITFEPYPKEFFSPVCAPPRISLLRDKISRLAHLGVDQFVLLKFDQALASMRPEDFVQQVLVDGLNVRFLVVGDDFHFGYQREGNFSVLQQAGKVHGFSVAQMPTCEVNNQRVSSSRVRQALQQHDLPLVTRLLGRPYRITGRVIRGKQLGRLLCFPTANLSLPEFQMAVGGVYAVRVHGLSERPLNAIANVGTQPTVKGIQPLLEVHILDFNADLYGRYIAVDFYCHIRREVKFASLKELKQQIKRDADAVRIFFKNQSQVV